MKVVVNTNFHYTMISLAANGLKKKAMKGGLLLSTLLLVVQCKHYVRLTLDNFKLN